MARDPGAARDGGHQRSAQDGGGRAIGVARPSGWPPALAVPVGRDAELAAVDAFLTAAWPGALTIEGPVGIGKTTLLAATLARARDRGIATIVARASVGERELAYATLIGLLPDERIDELLRAIAGPRRHALELALRRIEGEAEDELDVAALGLAIRDALRLLGRGGATIVAIDDLQWCDAATASALSFAFRRLESTPVGLLGTIRTGTGAAAGPGTSIPDAFAPERRMGIRVAPLSLGAIGRLVGRSSGRPRSRREVRYIAETAAGNPLFALELARAIDARGSVDPAAAAAGVQFAIPVEAEPLIDARLADLARFALDLAAAVASAGRLPVAATPALASALGLPADAAVRDAVAAGAIESDGPDLRPGHPLVGAAAIALVEPARRRAIHRALASVLDDPGAQARHLALAAEGPDAVAAARCDDAAHDAARRGATATAADLAELAVALTDPSSLSQAAGDLVRRRADAARWRLADGDPGAAERHLDAGRAAAATPADRVAIGLVAIEHAYLTGGRPRARAVAEAVLRDAESAAADLRATAPAAADPGAAARATGERPILVARVLAAMLSYATEDAREEEILAERVLDALAGREEEEPLTAAMALAVLADARLARGQGPDIGLLDRAVEFAAGHGDAAIAARRRYAAVLRTSDRLDASREAFGWVLAQLETAGLETPRVNDLAHAAWTEVLAGDHVAAAHMLDASLALAADLGTEAVGSRVYRAHLDALLGEHRAAAIAAGAGLAATEAEGDRWTMALWERAIGTNEFLGGDPGVAADAFATSLRVSFEFGIFEPNWFRVDADLVEALVAAGRLDEAQAALAGFHERAATAGLAWSAVASARARAVVQLACDDPEAALASLDAVAGLAADLPLALERGRVALVRGSALRRVRRIREARAVLMSARETFEAAPSPPWVRRAQSGLDRLGGRPAGADTLSPAERRVAELAADGLTNREIAASLVVGVRTVESQLSAVYGKLGVRGRAGLARALTTSDGDDATES